MCGEFGVVGAMGIDVVACFGGAWVSIEGEDIVTDGADALSVATASALLVRNVRRVMHMIDFLFVFPFADLGIVGCMTLTPMWYLPTAPRYCK